MVRRLAFVVDEGSHDSFLFLSPENLGIRIIHGTQQ